MLVVTCGLCRDTREGRRRALAEIDREIAMTGRSLVSALGGQPFPTTGQLAKHLNLPLRDLRVLLAGEIGDVYCYVETSIELHGYSFVQSGSGPNFQGGLVTLCTCMHQMRSGQSEKAWPGSWVAGFTSRTLIPNDGRDFISYLMKVGRAYHSHSDLWDDIPEDVREAKAADRHRLGDLYRPAGSIGDPFDPASYVEPRADHSHCELGEWQEDISYASPWGRRPALLVGDPQLSFLWSRPGIALKPPQLHRGHKILSVQELIEDLLG
jgi:hypothetical protein